MGAPEGARTGFSTGRRTCCQRQRQGARIDEHYGTNHNDSNEPVAWAVCGVWSGRCGRRGCRLRGVVFPELAILVWHRGQSNASNSSGGIAGYQREQAGNIGRDGPYAVRISGAACGRLRARSDRTDLLR